METRECAFYSTSMEKSHSPLMKLGVAQRMSSLHFPRLPLVVFNPSSFVDINSKQKDFDSKPFNTWGGGADHKF